MLDCAEALYLNRGKQLNAKAAKRARSKKYKALRKSRERTNKCVSLANVRRQFTAKLSAANINWSDGYDEKEEFDKEATMIMATNKVDQNQG
jgi:hypothetical protein